MVRSKLETDFRRLLHQCENVASSSNSWRLEKYVDTLEKWLLDLRKGPNQPSIDDLANYNRQVVFLRKYLESEQTPSVLEKTSTTQYVTHALPNVNALVTKEIHHKATSKCLNELRSELLNSDGIRQRSSKSEAEYDVESIMKVHHDRQEKIVEGMLELAGVLKDQSVATNKILRNDIEDLSKANDVSDANQLKLDKEVQRLVELNKYYSFRCCELIMGLLVISTFLFLVLFMRVFKKP